MLYEAQQLLVTRDFTPTNMKVRPLDVPFSVIDPAQILDQGDRWTKLYDEIVVKQGRSADYGFSVRAAARSPCPGSRCTRAPHSRRCSRSSSR